MKILIAAGGTGGHLYPGLAVARALSGHDILFVVRRGDLGRDILKKEGFAVEEISGQGLPRSLSPKLFTFPFVFIQGWLDTWSLLKRYRPDRVLGMGGYLSVPVVMTAHALGIRTMLHEQNVFPGLANRLLSRWADSVAISFPASQPYFKGKNVWVSGLPIRREIGRIDKTAARASLGLTKDLTTFLVFGGSLGAAKLNSTVVDAWPLLIQKNIPFQVLHVTGAKDFDRVRKLYEGLQICAQVLPYCHQMAEAYAAADAVICRAGASTIAELQAAKRPALLIPYPYASNNHQLYNAQVLEKRGQAKVISDQALTPMAIADFLFSKAAESTTISQPPEAGDAAASRIAKSICF